MKLLTSRTKESIGALREQRGSLHFVIPVIAILLVAAIGTLLLVFSSASTSDCPGASGQKEGSRVATAARHQWCIWNGGRNSNGKLVSHETLLSWYTDGSPHEDWCADFVSYVYQEAGYPFRRGVSNWDIKAAAGFANVVTLKKEPASYSPKVGDIVYLQGPDYPAGHVEIVIETSPLKFIYGNSGTRDPATGNGEMKEGPKPSDIQYYLTPS